MAFEELDRYSSVDELNARDREISDELTRLNEAYGVKPMSEEDRERFAELKTERDEIRQRVQEYEARMEIVQGAAARKENREVASFQTSRPSAVRRDDIYDLTTIRWDKAADDFHDRAMRAIDSTNWATPNGETNEEVQERVSTLLDRLGSEDDGAPSRLAQRILKTNTPAYKRAFSKYLSGSHMSQEEDRALGIGSQGGNYPVPVALDPTVVLTSNGVINPVRQIANVVQISGNTYNGVVSDGVSAAYAAEFTEASDNSPTLTQPAANVEKVQAFIPYSIEQGQDWGALQSEMARMLADAKDTLESDKFLKGLGHSSNQPEGLLVGATGTVLTATASIIQVADLYSMLEALAPRWRARAVFTGSLAAFNRIRQLDTAGGANLWVQLQFGQPGNLIGRPAHEWSDYSGAITTAGASVMTYGDFNQFLIVDRVGMDIEVIPHLFATANNRPSGSRGLYAHWRNTSDVRVASAFKTLKIQAA